MLDFVPKVRITLTKYDHFQTCHKYDAGEHECESKCSQFCKVLMTRNSCIHCSKSSQLPPGLPEDLAAVKEQLTYKASI